VLRRQASVVGVWMGIPPGMDQISGRAWTATVDVIRARKWLNSCSLTGVMIPLVCIIRAWRC